MKFKKSYSTKIVAKAVRNGFFASSLVAALAPAIAESQVVFEETFDSLPDYTSSKELNLPGWSFRRNGEVNWSPSNGHPDKHDAFEILASNADKARGGIGKSFVAWKESYNPGWKQWNSDGILAKYFEDGLDQFYVSFYVRFGDNWTQSGSSKLFRAYSWSGEGSPFKFFSDGNSGPIFLWDYVKNDYGIRNRHAYRGGPHGESYDMTKSSIGDMPRNILNRGDVSLNFTSDTLGMGVNGGTPKIVDQVGGGYISDDLNQTVSHEQVFGTSEHWTKMAFFFKMNSNPGVNDGTIIQWVNDEQVFLNRTIRWVDDNSENKMVKWNVVAIGGNDFFQEYPNSDRREEWYSIDDIVIRTNIPDYLGEGIQSLTPPNPPATFHVQ